MTSQKFDLVRNLPKQPQKLERLTSIESCKFSDRMSQDGTEYKQNPKRKTVIVVEEHGEDRKNGSVVPVLKDKG